MRQIVVTVDFKKDKIIGVIGLYDDVKIPIDGVFAIGGIEKKTHIENGVKVVDEFELLEVSLVSDVNYKKFLEQK